MRHSRTPAVKTLPYSKGIQRHLCSGDPRKLILRDASGVVYRRKLCMLRVLDRTSFRRLRLSCSSWPSGGPLSARPPTRQTGNPEVLVGETLIDTSIANDLLITFPVRRCNPCPYLRKTRQLSGTSRARKGRNTSAVQPSMGRGIVRPKRCAEDWSHGRAAQRCPEPTRYSLA